MDNKRTRRKIAAAVLFGILLQLVSIEGTVKKRKEVFFMKKMEKRMKRKTSGFILLFEGLMILLVFTIAVFVSAGKNFSVANFLDATSIVLLALFTVPVLFVSGMAGDFVRVFWIGKKPCSLAQMKKTLESIKMMQRLVLCGAGFVTLIEIIIIFEMLDDPFTIGPNMAVAILVDLYGLIAEAVLIPLSAYVQSHITDALDVVEEDTEFPAVPAVVDRDEEK